MEKKKRTKAKQNEYCVNLNLMLIVTVRLLRFLNKTTQNFNDTNIFNDTF